MVKDIPIGVEGHGFNPRASKMEHSLATAATFLRSCVVQAISHGDGPRHSLHASAHYLEYNED